MNFWLLGQTYLFMVATVAAAEDLCVGPLGVFPIVLTCGLRRDGHGTAGGVDDSWGKPPPEP